MIKTNWDKRNFNEFNLALFLWNPARPPSLLDLACQYTTFLEVYILFIAVMGWFEIRFGKIIVIRAIHYPCTHRRFKGSSSHTCMLVYTWSCPYLSSTSVLNTVYICRATPSASQYFLNYFASNRNACSLLFSCSTL